MSALRACLSDPTDRMLYEVGLLDGVSGWPGDASRNEAKAILAMAEPRGNHPGIGYRTLDQLHAEGGGWLAWALAHTLSEWVNA